MGSPITFVTPSHARDYERFAFQRESMARCGIDVQHVAVVNTEDVELFRQTPHRDGLVVASTQDVLPFEVEEKRTEGRISGWWIQQLVKLGAAEIVDTDYVWVDSDTFWVRQVTADDFYAPTGELYLFEYQWISAEIIRWLSASLDFWEIPPQQQIVPVRYVYPIVPASLAIARDMLTDTEERSGTSWCEAFLNHGGVESTMYGVYARYVRGLEGLLPFEADYCLGYFEREYDRFVAEFSEALASPDAKAAMVHPHLGVSAGDLRRSLEPIWRQAGG